ncbi:MAG: hypothetical protein GY792_02320 [Gammaproteobacteria bacterium]|nr:hypothetical protein [Gammaproteobacteria bacterium]
MQQKYQSEIRLNEFGRPDIEFYTREAKRLRAEAFSKLIHDFSQWLGKTFTHRHGFPMRTVH